MQNWKQTGQPALPPIFPFDLVFPRRSNPKYGKHIQSEGTKCDIAKNPLDCVRWSYNPARMTLFRNLSTPAVVFPKTSMPLAAADLSVLPRHTKTPLLSKWDVCELLLRSLPPYTTNLAHCSVFILKWQTRKHETTTRLAFFLKLYECNSSNF